MENMGFLRACRFILGVGMLTFLIGNTSARATHVQVDQKRKQEVLIVLSNKIKLHKTQTLEEIKKMLLEDIARTEEFLEQEGRLDDQSQWIEQSKQQVNDLSNKDEFLESEELRLQELVSTTNVNFAVTRRLVAINDINSGACVAVVACIAPSVLLDVILLPFTLVGTIATGC